MAVNTWTWPNEQLFGAYPSTSALTMMSAQIGGIHLWPKYKQVHTITSVSIHFVDVSDSCSRRYIEVYGVEYRPQDGSDHDALQERCNHRKGQKCKECE
jgi:hypothetical protein